VDYVSVAPADLASHVVYSAPAGLLPKAAGIRASVQGDALALRATVNVKDLGAGTILGPLARALGDSEEIEFRGTFHAVRAGLVEFRVARLRLGSVPVPSAFIGPLVRNMYSADRPPEISSLGVPVVVPEFVSEIRISGGRVLIYRRTESK
jgi:hypothetical protein